MKRKGTAVRRRYGLRQDVAKIARQMIMTRLSASTTVITCNPSPTRTPAMITTKAMTIAASRDDGYWLPVGLYCCTTVVTALIDIAQVIDVGLRHRHRPGTSPTGWSTAATQPAWAGPETGRPTRPLASTPEGPLLAARPPQHRPPEVPQAATPSGTVQISV